MTILFEQLGNLINPLKFTILYFKHSSLYILWNHNLSQNMKWLINIQPLNSENDNGTNKGGFFGVKLFFFLLFKQYWWMLEISMKIEWPGYSKFEVWRQKVENWKLVWNNCFTCLLLSKNLAFFWWFRIKCIEYADQKRKINQKDKNAYKSNLKTERPALNTASVNNCHPSFNLFSL